MNSLAKEARIDVADPVHGKHLGQVCLRPVNLNELDQVLDARTAVARRHRQQLAYRLAFGEDAAG